MKNKIKNNVKYKCIICVQSDYSELNRIREFVQQNASIFGFTDIEASKITLAVDEACTNIIKHTHNHDKSKEIWVAIDTENENFIVNILNEGNPFDPLQVPQQNMNEYFKGYKRGGLGISIMKKLIDDIKYFPHNESFPKNILRLTKSLH